MQFWAKMMPNNRLVVPFEVGTSLGEILDPLLVVLCDGVVCRIHQCDTFVLWCIGSVGVIRSLCGVWYSSVWYVCHVLYLIRGWDTIVPWYTGAMGVTRLSSGVQDVLLKEEEIPSDERIDGIGMGTHNLLRCKCLRSLILFIWSN